MLEKTLDELLEMPTEEFIGALLTVTGMLSEPFLEATLIRLRRDPSSACEEQTNERYIVDRNGVGHDIEVERGREEFDGEIIPEE